MRQSVPITPIREHKTQKLCYLFDYRETNRNSTVAINMTASRVHGLVARGRQIPPRSRSFTANLSPILNPTISPPFYLYLVTLSHNHRVRASTSKTFPHERSPDSIRYSTGTLIRLSESRNRRFRSCAQSILFREISRGLFFSPWTITRQGRQSPGNTTNFTLRKHSRDSFRVFFFIFLRPDGRAIRSADFIAEFRDNFFFLCFSFPSPSLFRIM